MREVNQSEQDHATDGTQEENWIYNIKHHLPLELERHHFQDNQIANCQPLTAISNV